MQTKSLNFALELKDAESSDESGVFTGLASVYGVVDRVQDVVLAGAFKASLAENGGQVPLLYQHRQDQPIGLGVLTDTEGGLSITGKLALKVPEAAKAWELMRAGVIKSLSIGYDTVRSTMEGGIRQLQELKLWEVSLVTIPANPLATVLSMKAHQVAGLVDAVKAGQNGAVDALFDAVAELVGELATEVKGGRGLTSRNLALIKRVVDSLSAFVAGDPASTTDPDPQVADAEAKALHANFTESFNALIALTKRG